MAHIKHTKEYLLIKAYYKKRRTERSKVLLINHIDEGLWILDQLAADLTTQKAYCLHPLFQADTDLLHSAEKFTTKLRYLSSQAVLLAMEYRHIANGYLSYHQIKHIDDIKLSPLKQIRQMLIADKVQNRKDFERYHLHRHPRSIALQTYFNNWMKKLEISEEQYQEWVEGLQQMQQKPMKIS